MLVISVVWIKVFKNVCLVDSFYEITVVKVKYLNTCEQFSMFNSFRTPTIRRSLLGSTPRTPTPFKNALAAQEKKYGPLKLTVCNDIIYFLVI